MQIPQKKVRENANHVFFLSTTFIGRFLRRCNTNESKQQQQLFSNNKIKAFHCCVPAERVFLLIFFSFWSFWGTGGSVVATIASLAFIIHGGVIQILLAAGFTISPPDFDFREAFETACRPL